MEMTTTAIRYQYWVLGKSTAACAEVFGVSAETFRRRMVALSIPRRSKTEGFAGWNKGLPLPMEQRAAISATRKESYASGELQHWNKGQHWPEEVRKKISLSLLDGRSPADSYYGPDWRSQRTLRLQIDDHACQQCGSADALEVHHWEPFRFCFDNSLDNLVTLCWGCHRDKHRQYRREGWTQEAEGVFYA